MAVDLIRCGFNIVFFLQLGLATVLVVVDDLLLEVILEGGVVGNLSRVPWRRRCGCPSGAP